ncbi:hormogonium polysaccharide biosynthesis protein HpsA [Microcoleus sp. PH2017_18_LLB_O_A]|uniref:hormogonium polysaccharide biosynthesis protein HpsA n=1 Tax=Microcoleus sp. PH2017_18_LLB_O_A TaxID=2798829 RepID=UPI001E122F9B|nr:hormogonium polysaccharide biosynthesis protein HpsA [Microcoleus sp. PH2017_18_LLB_O_A]MCC3519434.1 hypothetical protein [Microcoleus sp. PH2017_18_LLB_O_A]
MFKSKLSKVIVSLLRRIAGVTRSGAKRLMRAMLQALMAMGRRAKLPVAGFVLPTVTMVLLVVILLTVAIVLRSFDRANMARNVRVNQQVLAAATPALDRAKAKIQYLLYEDPQRPTSTPSDAEMYRIMSESGTSDLYKFGDEQRLILKYPVINGTSLTPGRDDFTKPPLERLEGGAQESEAINTAWRYPVDTNNDGKFDTFTLYGIFFRNPPLKVEANGDISVARSRKPLDARTPPMALGALDPGCASGGTDSIASLVGDSGWYKLDGKLRKSFFVYTVNVPIKDAAEAATVAALGPAVPFTGTPSISALEYQQDQARIPLSNNAVVYEDDLEISPGPALNLNGRILTNSNLLVGGTNDPKSVTLFEVSSKGSCFYDQENSKIQVAGNVVNGWSGNTTLTVQPVTVHLFKKINPIADQPNIGAPKIDPDNRSVSNTSLDIIYNSNAYSRRLNALVEGQKDAQPDITGDPVSVQLLVKPPVGSTKQPLSRENALESYFKERLRKVPFKEVALGAETLDVPERAVTPYTTYLEGSGDSLRPKKDWSFPTTTDTTVIPDKGSTNGPTKLALLPTQLLSSKDPDKIESTESETKLGERVLVGNNLPAQRWNDGKSKFLGATEKQEIEGATWDDKSPRTRRSQLTKLADVGATDRGNGLGEKPGSDTPPFRDGFWEAVAAQTPKNPLDGTGGLRVITSAGVYDRTYSFLPPPRWNDGGNDGTTTSERGPEVSVSIDLSRDKTYDDPATTDIETYPVVWPDTMPMSPLGPGSQVHNNVSGAWEAWPAGVIADGTGLQDITTASTTLLPGIRENAAKKYAKGDLRMRATAVYHYAINSYNPDSITGTAQPDQLPYACVSSYYDPSNAFTARNITSLGGPEADVSGQGENAPYKDRQKPALGARQAFIGSNNGITYEPPKRDRRPGLSTPGTGGLLTGGDPVLAMQANLVFPDGRFANGPLRTALQVAPEARTLAQQAAIDSTNCAIDILSKAIAPDLNLIPHGAIQEVAFLNGREVKAIERDDSDTPTINEAFTLSGPIPLTNDTRLKVNYNQPLEERQPLEIRATQLNMNALRRKAVTGTFATGEWLLPNSGIIYASRDDALPDRSDRTANKTATGIDEATSKKVSPTDGVLDPSRKPNGILLINGNYLFRNGDTPTNAAGKVENVVKEKGLTLVSNLPVYIQDQFNPHGRIPPATPGGPPATFTEVEEFTRTVAADWGNFYDRTKGELDPNFACREGDPRLPKCGGDYWRPATVLADSVTLLSRNYRFGFRNEGDFDLRNNAGSEAVLRRRQRGFFNNNFVTNGLSSGAFLTDGNLKPAATSTTDPTVIKDANYSTVITAPLPVERTSSYFNNFVTPVQRRGDFPEYLMEVCTRLPVSECTDDQWFVNPAANLRAPTLTTGTPTASYIRPDPNDASSFQAGSTVDPPAPGLQRFPRRVAFNRDATSHQLLPDAATPQPLGMTTGTTITAASTPPAVDPARKNSLWFATGSRGTPTYDVSTIPYMLNTSATIAGTIDGSNTPLPVLGVTTTVESPDPLSLQQGTQPLLLPFPQIRDVTATAANPGGGDIVKNTGWMVRAENTTFNLIIGAGDTPSQNLNGTTGDTNGGLQNLPRFLENWKNDPTNIKGSFIQLNRSAYNTAPFLPILGELPSASVPTDKMVSVFHQLSPALDLGIPNRYNTDGNQRRMPYFTPPTRNWGYDVGLLPQPPDLFTQKFTTPPSRSQPAEFFREVPRNDPWVKTLMCGVKADDRKPATSSVTSGECEKFPY